MKKKIAILGIVVFIMVNLSGCLLLDNERGKINELLRGRTATITTFDEDGNAIDNIRGKSISIAPLSKFDTENEKGETIKKTSVINISIGKNEMIHVGSSLLLYEDGLNNILNKYQKTVNVQNDEKGVPILNRMVNSYKNDFKGKSKVILIRSQSGKPLATFLGDNVGIFSTGIEKTTGIQIDKKYLFIYKCDYSIYDTKLLNKEEV